MFDVPLGFFRKNIKIIVQDGHFAVALAQILEQPVIHFTPVYGPENVEIQKIIVSGIAPEKVKTRPAIKHTVTRAGLIQDKFDEAPLPSIFLGELGIHIPQRKEEQKHKQ